MRLSILFLSLFAWVCAVQAETVSRPVSFEVGETVGISVKKDTRRWQQGNLVREESISTLENMEFLENLGEGYRVRITGAETVIETQDEGRKAVFDSLARALQGTWIELDTDEAGRPVRARNWKPVIKTVTQAVNQNTPDASPQAAAAVAAVLASFLKMDDAGAASQFGQNLALLADTHNFEMTVGEPVNYLFSSPNPFGGPAVEFDVTATLTSADNGVAVIEVQQQATEASIEQMLLSLLTLMKVPEGAVATMRDQLEQQGTSLSYATRFEIGLADGRTTRVTQQKLMRIGELIKDEENKVLEANYTN